MQFTRIQPKLIFHWFNFTRKKARSHCMDRKFSAENRRLLPLGEGLLRFPAVPLELRSLVMCQAKTLSESTCSVLFLDQSSKRTQPVACIGWCQYRWTQEALRAKGQGPLEKSRVVEHDLLHRSAILHEIVEFCDKL